MQTFKMLILSFSICLLSTVCVAAPNSWTIDNASTQRRVCGLHFARVPGLVVDVKKISESELVSRANNERFNACPYWVKAKIGSLSIHIDFSEEITLWSLRDPGHYVIASYVSFEDGQWRSTSPHPDSRDDTFHVTETANDYTVTSLTHEYLENSKVSRYCFSIVAISKDRYAVGGTCSKNKSVLVKKLGIWLKKPIARFD